MVIKTYLYELSYISSTLAKVTSIELVDVPVVESKKVFIWPYYVWWLNSRGQDLKIWLVWDHCRGK